MMNHDGWMLAGGGFMWLFWIVLIVVIVLVVGRLSNTGGASKNSHNEDSLEIIKSRYARGEINEDEFECMRKKLSS